MSSSDDILEEEADDCPRHVVYRARRRDVADAGEHEASKSSASRQIDLMVGGTHGKLKRCRALSVMERVEEARNAYFT